MTAPLHAWRHSSDGSGLRHPTLVRLSRPMVRASLDFWGGRRMTVLSRDFVDLSSPVALSESGTVVFAPTCVIKKRRSTTEAFVPAAVDGALDDRVPLSPLKASPPPCDGDRPRVDPEP